MGGEKMMKAAWILVLIAGLGCGEPSRNPAEPALPGLHLEIYDAGTGKKTPARFAIHVDGKPYYPDRVGKHGVRFYSVHEAKREYLVVTYARGTGAVEVPLPDGAKELTVDVAKGFEYYPASARATVKEGRARVRIELRRWADSVKKGWVPADEHVHYARPDRAGDPDWLAMMAGDGLNMAHFMVLKGGKVPGIWGHSHAYGKEGEAFDGERLIRPGEEYRDTAMGHINLLGVEEVIQPISTGGMGKPPFPYNYPALHEVMLRATRLGGLSGVAHGGYLGRQPTAIVDAVLGAVEFFEIANTHLFATDLWYRLLNCGYDLPPAGGTDLPNFPFRDPWQPFLGSVRMYVDVGDARDFASWKAAVRKGRTYVTSGPTLQFSVAGEGPGGLVRLPAGGGEVEVSGELATPVGLRRLELVRNGKVVPIEVGKRVKEGVHRWTFRARLRVNGSSWLALRGEGVPIEAIQYVTKSGRPGLKADVIAHSAPVRVEVGGRPIRSRADSAHLIGVLRKQVEYYRTRGKYENDTDREKIQALFRRAIAELEKR